MAVTTWTFASGKEGWTLRDDSTGSGAFSTITYDGAAAALEQHAFVPAIAGRLSRGWALSPTLGVTVVNGDTIAMDVSALTGSSLSDTTRRVKAIYTDETSEEQTAVGQGAVTVTLTMSATKTLDHIELVAVEVGNGGADTEFSWFCDLLEVRLTTAAAFVGTGERPLELDVDLAGGNKIWATKWKDGGLFLTEHSSALALQNTFAIATGTTATAVDITNRTYYMTPYAPPFFGTAGLDDIVYLFGRWDDSGVAHLEKSVDGGASFSDIGDSGTWGAGWVGGFFADDANTLFAFVNGGSRALYRSIDAGSSWTNLSSLPFDIDPGGVSKHPDGRILIINRNAGAQMAAYAESPDYSSWIDATGSPNFPTAGGGSNSIIWIT